MEAVESMQIKNHNREEDEEVVTQNEKGPMKYNESEDEHTRKGRVKKQCDVRWSGSGDTGNNVKEE